MSQRPSIITLTTDFGYTDSYVAELKGVLLRLAPKSLLVDVTHDIARHDILAGSITLARVVDSFPTGTIHLAVVDPGVGTSRRLIVAKVKGAMIVCPDNGLITWAWRLNPGGIAREITWRPARFSNVFQGRDIMAPIAGMLAADVSLARRTRPIADPFLLNVAPAANLHNGRIIHIDHFGNATTNIQEAMVADAKIKSVRVGRRRIGPIRQTYVDVAIGSSIALIGSSGLLEIAVRNGSAAKELHLKIGDTIHLQ